MSDWPVNLRMRAITTWPTERTVKRRTSPFSSPLSDTLALLGRELRALSATDVWMEIAIKGDPTSNPLDWRQDGRPRAHARPDHPGVVVSFTSLALKKELRYATDRFRSWPDNLRAVALGLEALRKVDRYGIANRGEQYAGWAQITAGGPDRAHGYDLIVEHGSVAKALRATHPDTSGYDSASDFADVQAARDAA